jgi:WD40 repeat protein
MTADRSAAFRSMVTRTWGKQAMPRRLALVLIFSLFADAAWAQAPSGASAIFVMKADGSEARKVVEVKGHWDHGSPRWSHDGRSLVFDARLGAAGERACFVVGADGGGLRELAKGRSPDFSPDDRQIAFEAEGAAGSPEINVQNLDGQGRVKIATGRNPRWSSDGGTLAYSNGKMLRAVDLVGGEERNLLPAPVDVVAGFAWSPDGTQLAVVAQPSADGPRQLVVIDPAKPNQRLAPRLASKLDGFVSYSPDGKQLLYSEAGEIHSLDVAGDAPPRKLAGQQDKNRHPAFSPDGKWIAFASSRRVPQSAPARMAVTGREKILKELRRHKERSIVWSLDFTPDSRRVVMGGASGKGVQVWDLTNGETRDLGGSGMLIQVLPDGRRFVTSWVQRTAHMIDVESGDVLREFNHGGRIWAFALSPDGRKLLTGGLDKVIRIWDAETGDPLVTFEAQPDYTLRAMFSPDGKEVICANHDQNLAVFDAATGKKRLAIEHPNAVWGVAVSPDGRHILSGTGGSLTGSLTGLNVGEGDDNVVRMWDRETGKLVREMKGHSGGVFCLDASPDGRLAASGSTDGTLRLWDLATGSELSTIGPGKGIVACVRFSPDGKLLVAGGGVARIAGQMVEFPNEQIRVYQVLDTAEQAAAASGK